MIIIQPPVRGQDSQGAGHYLAPRGNHLHHGVDFACAKGSTVLSLTDGCVTKIGYPYSPADSIKGHLRYVQVSYDELDYRYFYISPLIKVGDTVSAGDKLGVTQGLTLIYPGITDHFHFEIMRGPDYINPEGFLE